MIYHGTILRALEIIAMGVVVLDFNSFFSDTST
jgi:hypothetical protein